MEIQAARAVASVGISVPDQPGAGPGRRRPSLDTVSAQGFSGLAAGPGDADRMVCLRSEPRYGEAVDRVVRTAGSGDRGPARRRLGRKKGAAGAIQRLLA